MTKQAIEVEGLPEGCEAVAVQFEPNYFNKYTGDDGYIYFEAKVKVKKIQPRRIVLEDAGEERNRPRLNSYTYFYTDSEGFDRFKVLSQVKETDIPLTNEVKMGVSQGDGDEPKLELSVKELRNVRSLIKDFENLGWFINPERALLLQKITEFIKDK